MRRINKRDNYQEIIKQIMSHAALCIERWNTLNLIKILIPD